jgi:predicted phosphoadenosine phosphosulfate sulfurtransferase
MNVHEAAIARLRYLFDEFGQVAVSFSGGKDSGVLLNLALEVARERARKIHVLHIDYEAQYQMTTEYVAATLAEIASDGHTVHHVCLPLRAQCATSMHQDHWIPWDREKQDLWVRSLPTGPGVITEANAWPWFRKGMWDYELQERFGRHLAETHGTPVCVLVGIRTQESLNRWRAIHSDRNINKYSGRGWTRWDGQVCNAYPIFDWLTEDIWTANARFGWRYNRLYDLYYQAGVPVDKMRVASPFNDYATESLHLYRAIDPDNWGRMVGRVNGVNFTGIYGGTTAMGWKRITKPPGHTWKSYMEFLLSTLPKATADNYRRKLEASKRSWVVGGAMDAETIAQLEAEGAPIIRTGEKSKRSTSDKEVVRFHDYLDDTTVDDFRRIPTYKRMCICIMKNDHTCKYMGFAQTKAELERRRAVIEKYKELL